MSERDLETVLRLVGPWADGATNIAQSIEEPELIAAAREVIAEDAVIEFATPEGGFVGRMAGPFRGPEGFLAGWREWVLPWSELRADVEHTHDLGDGRVLFEVELVGTVAGSSVPVVQPAAALYEVDGERLVRIDQYLDRAQARRAAGLD